MTHHDHKDEERKHDADLPPDAEDVRAKKDHVTEGPRGLQLWGEDAEMAPKGSSGDAEQGTAERQARITRGQHEQQRAESAKSGKARAQTEADDGDEKGGDHVALEQHDPTSSAARVAVDPEHPERERRTDAGRLRDDE